MSTVVVVATTAAVVAVSAGAKVIMDIRDRKAYLKALNKEIANFSETDNKMLEKTRGIISDVFGQSPAEALRTMDSVQKLDTVKKFIESLISTYGLDNDIKVALTNNGKYLHGYYDPETKTVQLNILMLLLDDADKLKNYDDIVITLIHTIIHELRHAVQCTAVEKDGFWDVDETRRKEWKYNYENYISAEVNFKQYCIQPIEADAGAFANEALRGVYNYVDNKL